MNIWILKFFWTFSKLIFPWNISVAITGEPYEDFEFFQLLFSVVGLYEMFFFRHSSILYMRTLWALATYAASSGKDGETIKKE